MEAQRPLDRVLRIRPRENAAVKETVMKSLSRLSLVPLVLILFVTTLNAQNTAQAQPQARPPAAQQGITTIYVQSSTVYLKRELMAAVLQSRPEFAASGMAMAPSLESADLVLDVTRPFLTFDWTWKLTTRGEEVASGVVQGWDAQEIAPKIASEVARQLPSNKPTQPLASANPSQKSVYVHSDTVYLKDEVLHRALTSSPAWRGAGLMLAGDRTSAVMMIDVVRPFLTYDWNWTVRDAKTSALIASGKVVADDGGQAAPQLAQQILPAMLAKIAPAAQTQSQVSATAPAPNSWKVEAFSGNGPQQEFTVTVNPSVVTFSGPSGVFNIPTASIVNVRYSTMMHDPSEGMYNAWKEGAREVGEYSEYAPVEGAVAGATLLAASPIYLGTGLISSLNRSNEGYVHLAWEENGNVRTATMYAGGRKEADQLFAALLLAKQQAQALASAN